MSGLTCRVMVFASSLTLLFPPGWCCARPFTLPVKTISAEQQNPLAPVEPPPCPHCTPPAGPRSHPQTIPALPSRTCCCQHVSTLPPGSESVAALTPWFVLVVPSGTDLCATLGMQREADSLPFSPPLQLLHCVWRC